MSKIMRQLEAEGRAAREAKKKPGPEPEAKKKPEPEPEADGPSKSNEEPMSWERWRKEKLEQIKGATIESG
jgi:hypothetical protein